MNAILSPLNPPSVTEIIIPNGRYDHNPLLFKILKWMHGVSTRSNPDSTLWYPRPCAVRPLTLSCTYSSRSETLLFSKHPALSRAPTPWHAPFLRFGMSLLTKPLSTTSPVKISNSLSSFSHLSLQISCRYLSSPSARIILHTKTQKVHETKIFLVLHLMAKQS